MASMDCIEDWVRPKVLTHDAIGMIWAHQNGTAVDEDMHGYRKEIGRAVIDEELLAKKVFIKDQYTVGADWEDMSEDALERASEAWRTSQIPWREDQVVLFKIHRDDFLAWLKKSGRWPLDPGCALIHWFERGKYLNTEEHSGIGDDSAALTKKRKKLKPLQRETNSALLLLYELFKQHQVVYLDDLPANKAWGKIISGEFSSDYIKCVAETKKAIFLKDEYKLSKNDFLEKYRKRFK